ncbi:MAG: glutamine synthetase family protein [Bacteroidales bacterium]|nr:glutamine synthetase family protein [Bacteroidales bacterium]MDD4529717.1 glutamine synthetase family protein [Bacteroidales bacterium]
MKLNPNPIVQYLQKEPSQFTKSDIIKYIVENEIKMLDFHYAAGDGRLKTLNFVISSQDYLDQILSTGERVDGSSLFSFMEAGSSDLYVIPRFSTAFVDPFSSLETIGFICSYFDKDGNFLSSSPEYVLDKACKEFDRVSNGMEFWAMGELEYYVIGEEEPLFKATDQKGYHESTPFSKYEQFRTEAMYYIAQCGGQIKYGHSEVGNFTLENKIFEQNEIEFLPTPVRQAADQLMIGKWVIRTLAEKYGLDVTFAPKITVGKAGSGMHIHTRVVKDNKNMYVGENGLADCAKKVIAGMMKLAPSLTAVGNTNPTSYLRLVPHQEAPTTVCWGDRNRSTLVRVPLGWTAKTDMCSMANPLEKTSEKQYQDKQTVEFRCPDASANIYLLMAGLVVAARYGFEMENAIEFANNTYVSENIHKEGNEEKYSNLEQLPTSCYESAESLEKHREIYEQYGVFSKNLIDGLIKGLKKFDDKNLRTELEKHPDTMHRLVKQYFYCG